MMRWMVWEHHAWRRLSLVENSGRSAGLFELYSIGNNRRVRENRMLLIYFLHYRRQRFGGSLECMPEHDRPAPQSTHRGRTRRNIPDGDRPDVRVRGRPHLLDGHTRVHDHFAAGGSSGVDDGRPLVNILCRRGGQTVMSQLARIEVLHCDHREVVGLEAEIAIILIIHAPVTPAPAFHIHRARWQGCPATVISAHAPCHPRRPPFPIRTPDPAAAFVMMPAPIVKRSPTP